jgi:hypothetical protein
MSNNLFDIYNYNVFPKFNVNLKFKYNNYNPKDEEINLQQEIENYDFDMLLSNNEINSYSTIKIELDILNNSLYSYKTNKNINLLNNTLDLINGQSILSKIKMLEGKNLNSSKVLNVNGYYGEETDIVFLNNRTTTEDTLISIFNKPKSESIQKKIESYSKNKNNYLNVMSSMSTENIYDKQISKKYFKDIMNNKSNTKFAYDDKVFKHYSTGNNIKSELVLSEYLPDVYHFENNIENSMTNENISNDIDENLIFEKFKDFSVSTYSNENENIYCFFVGFLIKKHVKLKETGEIKKDVSSSFLYFDITRPVSKIVKFDQNIKYANYYSYEVLPVFCLSLVRNDNGPQVHHYLVTQTSFKNEFIRAIDYYQPEPPNALRARYLYNLNKVMLEWDNASNPQNDIIGYHIYRRSRLDESYELIKVYVKKQISNYRNFELLSDNIDMNDTQMVEILNSEVLKNEFIDNVDNIDNLYVYAICSFDAHGYVSNYSNQIAVRYSRIYNKLIVDNISLTNAPRTYPNIYVKRKSVLFEEDNLLFNFSPFFKNKKNIKLYFAPDTLSVKNENDIVNLSFQGSDYHLNICRLTDLETKNIKFNLK